METPTQFGQPIDSHRFNEDLRSYLGMIDRDWSWDMATWARAEMTDEIVYLVGAT